MAPLLRDKVALITGAASGIGLATAERFALEGAAVVLADVQADAAEAAAARLRGARSRAAAVVTDVTRSDEVRRAVETTVRAFGRLDVLFANAGVGYSGELIAATDDDWDQVMGVNAKGVFLCCRKSEEAGFDRHLAKPAEPEALLKMLAEATGAESRP